MRRCLVILLLTALVPAASGSAEDSSFPGLGEHVFVPVTTITEPFLITYVQSTVDLGLTLNSESSLIIPPDSVLISGIETNQLYAGLGFQYQQKAKDWLVVRLSLDIIGRLGTDSSSLLADGITAALSYDAGWMMRIFHSNSLLVSGSLGIGTSNASFVNLTQWGQSIGPGEDASLSSSTTSLVGYGGLHAAWGIDRRFGLLGSLYANYGESFDGSGDNSWYSDVRLALSYDIRQDLDIPLGLALTGGRVENDVNADSEAGTWFWALRFAIQGRTDFTLGLDFGMYYFDVANQSERLQASRFTIDMRYYY